LRTPIDSLTPEEIVQRAESLVSRLRRTADETEQNGYLLAENVRALHESGLFKVLLPHRFGGYQMSLQTHIETVERVGRGCASTAWCLGLWQANSWLMTLYSEAAQNDVYGPNPDALLAGVSAPVGRARITGDGYILSGSWPFCSGSHHSEWFILAAILVDNDGNLGEEGFLLVPRDAVTIKDDWKVMALRGTGSCTVTVENCFVARHRYVSISDAYATSGPGKGLHDGWLYKVPTMALLRLSLAPVALGAATGALEVFRDRIPGRQVPHSFGQQQQEMVISHLQVGDASAKIDVARLLFQRCASELQTLAEKGEDMSLLVRARFYRDCAYAVRQCLEATETLFLACGGSGIAYSNSIQRAARDVHAVSMHGGYNLPLNLETYGKVVLGQPLRGILR
jgi:alkylation response protein AidB-like acyl-CoA dehydrogenase